MNNDWKSFIKEKKEEYYRISSIKCPALKNEGVYFDHYGFNHLLYKKKKYRSRNEQTRRLCLIEFARQVISTSTKVATEIKSGPITFITLSKFIRGKKIIVVLRQINSGVKHFYSVFDENPS